MRNGFRRAVVTGGAGFLGSHLCEQLLARGTSVLCVDNLCTGSLRNVEHLTENSSFEVLEADVTGLIDAGSSPDLVVHMASPASPQHYRALPIETLQAGGQGTQRALDLAERHGARFLLVSTSEVYGDPQEHPQQESYWGNVNPVGPRAVYDEAKRYAEALTSAYRVSRGLNAGIARVFNSYGPRMRPDDGRVVPTFVRQAVTGQPLTVCGDGQQTRSLCYVDDTIRGLLALAHGAVAGPVNIGNPLERSVIGWARLIRTLAGSNSPIEHAAAVEDEPQRRCPDIALARTVLGWSPEVEVDEGLRRTIAWFRQDASHRPCGP